MQKPKCNLFPTVESRCDKKASSDENWPLKFGLPSRQSTLVFAAVNAIFLIISLIGNVIMFYLYSRFKVLRTPSNMLVINLSLANFLMHSKSWILIVNSIDGGPLLGDIGKWIFIIIRHKKHLLVQITFFAEIFLLLYLELSWPRTSLEIDGTLNTQNLTNPTIVSLVKMEYGWNFSISGLKMMVKSGLEKIFLKFLHALTIFY